jgi:uncharacterized protein (TIGR03089 family)
VTPSTFPELLARHLRASGALPLVTFYDDATGERVELSAVTFANWVAKTAGVLTDELELERGETVLLDLPTHWLAPVWLGACWSSGLAVTPDPDADSALVVCGPGGLERYAGGDRPVVALSLQPMGRRFTEPLPGGVIDFGVVVWGQPDSFVAVDPPGPEDLAWVDGDEALSQSEVLSRAAGSAWSAPQSRLLTDLAPVTPRGLEAFLAPLVGGGGTVWVANPDPAGWEHRQETERATVSFRTDQVPEPEDQPARS